MGLPPQLDAIIQRAEKVTLPGGVVGKVCKVLIVACLSIAAIACALRIMWVSVLALAFIFLLVFVLLWKLINFANKNPAAALLEGAEFLVHEQTHLGMKGIPLLENPAPHKSPTGSTEMTVEETAKASLPDTNP